MTSQDRIVIEIKKEEDKDDEPKTRDDPEILFSL